MPGILAVALPLVLGIQGLMRTARLTGESEAEHRAGCVVTLGLFLLSVGAFLLWQLAWFVASQQGA